MSDEIVANLEPKKWYEKQRFWAMFLGLIGTMAQLVPVPQVLVVGKALMAGALFLGYKGFSDQGDRVENIVKAEAKAMLNAPPY